jgi:GntR family transcriptional repressor for pyruvate dehydrogenase complex
VLDRGAEDGRLGPYIRDMMPRIRDIFEFRRAVECESARLAAIRRTDQHLIQLQAACDVLAAERETHRFRSADSQFHLGIAEAAGNRWMRDAIETARAAIWMPADPLYEQVLPLPAGGADHSEILDAIRAQAAEDAARLMGSHIDATVDQLERIASLHEAPARPAAAPRRRSAARGAG